MLFHFIVYSISCISNSKGSGAETISEVTWDKFTSVEMTYFVLGSLNINSIYVT